MFRASHEDAASVLWVVSFGALVTSFEASSLNALSPHIRATFGAAISTAGWMLTADLLATGGFLLVFGAMGDAIGHRAMYRCGLQICLMGSILCAAAPTMSALIAARAFHGAGTAMVLGNGPAMLTEAIPVNRLGSAFGTKMSCMYVGLILGPTVSGGVVGRFGWRPMFWIQATAALVGLALNTSVHTCTTASGGFMLKLARLIEVSHRTRDTVRALWLQPRQLAASAAGLAVAFTASQMLIFTLPFYLVDGRHQPSLRMGSFLGLYAVARLSVTRLSGGWSDRADPRFLTIPGMGLLALGLAILAAADERSCTLILPTALVLAGVGFGCFVPPNNKILMGSALQRRLGATAGIMASARTLGMATGVFLAGRILSIDMASLTDRARLAFGGAACLALTAAVLSVIDASSRQITTQRGVPDLRHPFHLPSVLPLRMNDFAASAAVADVTLDDPRRSSVAFAFRRRHADTPIS